MHLAYLKPMVAGALIRGTVKQDKMMNFLETLRQLIDEEGYDAETASSAAKELISNHGNLTIEGLRDKRADIRARIAHYS